MPDTAPIRVRLSDRTPPALPEPDQRLLLRAALLEPVGVRSAWQEWRRTGGSVESVDMATFRLLPLVYRSLETARVEDPDLPRLRGIYRHAWASNQRLAHPVGLALDSLRSNGIPTMLLKGAAVSLAHYRDLGARPMDDVDVLVPLHDAERALAMLEAEGWSMLVSIGTSRILRSAHATPIVGPDGAQIDLHWRVLVESARDEDFWSAAAPAELGGAATLVPGPAEQLLHTCAHAMRHPAASLRWIADAAVIIRSSGHAMDWGRLLAGVAARGVPLRTATALSVLVELLGPAVPHEVLDELNAMPPGPYERIILRLALRPVTAGGFVQLWELYRRHLADAGDDRMLSPDFLQYVADILQLPTRRAIATWLAKRAVSHANGRAALLSSGREVPQHWLTRYLRRAFDPRIEHRARDARW